MIYLINQMILNHIMGSSDVNKLKEITILL
jgi:hypothetical protein